MANQFGQLSYTVQDEIGTNATVLIPFIQDDTKTVATLNDVWETVGGELDLVTSAQITEVRVMLIYKPLEAWKTAPLSGSRVEQTGLVNFFNDVTRYRFGIDFAALRDSLISGGKIVIDSGALKTLCDTLVAGISADGTTFCNTAQQALSAIADALVSFRKHRAAVERRTKVVE